MIKIKNKLYFDAKALLEAMLLEFKLIFTDKAVFVAFFAVSIIIALVYTYVYSTEVINDLPIGVVDNDNTTHSRQLLRMIDAASQTEIKSYYTTLNEAQKAFEKDEIRGIAVIPSNFSKDLQRNEQPTVSIYADAAYLLYYKQVLTAVKKAVVYMNVGIQIKKKSAQGNLSEQARDRVMAVRGKVVSLYNPSSGYATFLMPIVLIIILQTTLLTSLGILGGTLIEEKKVFDLYPHSNNYFGTFPIVIGKATAHLIIGILVLIIYLGILMPAFKIPVRGSLLSILVFMIPFYLAVVYLGIFLISFFKQRETAILFMMFISIPALMLTGFSYPADIMPKWIQGFSYFIPSTMGTKGFISLTQMGADFSLVAPYWWWLWITCIFYFLLAALATKRVFIKAKKQTLL